MGAGFGANVQYVVRLGDDIEVVFDHDNRAAFIDEAVEDMDKLGDIVGMEADGGFLQHIEG